MEKAVPALRMLLEGPGTFGDHVDYGRLLKVYKAQQTAGASTFPAEVASVEVVPVLRQSRSRPYLYFDL